MILINERAQSQFEYQPNLSSSLLSLKMLPSKCAWCSWFGFNRWERDVELDVAHVDHIYRNLFIEGLSEHVIRKILRDIRGEPVHPRCLKYVRHAEEQLRPCSCKHFYIGNSTLDVDFDD